MKYVAGAFVAFLCFVAVGVQAADITYVFQTQNGSQVKNVVMQGLSCEEAREETGKQLKRVFAANSLSVVKDTPSQIKGGLGGVVYVTVDFTCKED